MRLQLHTHVAVWAMTLALGCGRDVAENNATPFELTDDAGASADADVTSTVCDWQTTVLPTTERVAPLHVAGPGPRWFSGAGGDAFRWHAEDEFDVLPTGGRSLLSSGWSPGDGALWATELPGVMLRWDAGWETLPSGADQAMQAVWGASPTDVWAVGINGVMSHWDGARWQAAETVVEDGHLEGLSGTSGSDIWAVGTTDDGGNLLHWDGTSWAVDRTDAPLHDVWAVSHDDVWAVGQGMLRYDGETWTPQQVPLGQWGGVWAAAPDDVWVIGVANEIRRFDGSQWTVEREGLGFLRGVGGRAGTDVWVGGEEGQLYRCVYR